MIMRLAWALLVLVIAGFTFGVQLDRQTRATPALASSVPEQFRAFAQARIAAATLRGEDPEIALVEAQKLVSRRPVPAEHLSMLAEAQYRAGLVEEGAYTIQIAAQRGWRDPFAQETMMRFALAAGDEAEASRRYTSLFLKNSTEDALLIEVGATLFSDSDGEGAKAMVAIVSGTDRWQSRFLQRGARVLPARTFVEMIFEAQSQGAVFDCGILRGAVRRLEPRGPEAAMDLSGFIEAQC